MNSRTSFYRNALATVVTAEASFTRGSGFGWAASLCAVLVLHLALASTANAYCSCCHKQNPGVCSLREPQGLCNQCKDPSNFQEPQSRDGEANNEEPNEEDSRTDPGNGSSAAEGRVDNESQFNEIKTAQELINLTEALEPGNPPSHARPPGSNAHRSREESPRSTQPPAVDESFESMQEFFDSLKPGRPPADQREPGSNTPRGKDTQR